MNVIPVDEVERGDILLVTKHPHDALAQLIVDLDQSSRGFSHAGVAGGNGEIICSLPRWTKYEPFDLGGVLHLSFDEFFCRGQAIHRLRLPDGASKERALQQMERYPEDRQGSFGWAKCVMVAAALHACVARERIGAAAVGAILAQARSAAQEWASPDDFYCAEFVAYLYGLEFTPDELAPPHTMPAAGPGEMVVGSRWDDLFRRVGRVVLGAFAGENQSRALKNFSRVVAENDPEFFELGFRRIRDLASHEAISRAHRVVDPSQPYMPPPDVLNVITMAPPDVLPDALVTPRMLEKWGTGTDVVEGSPETGKIGWKQWW